MGRPYSAASQLASASELRSRLRHQSTWYRGEPPANWRNFTHELARTETSFDTLPTATIPPLTRHAASNRDGGKPRPPRSKRATTTGKTATEAPSKKQTVRKTIQIPLYSMQEWYSLRSVVEISLRSWSKRAQDPSTSVIQMSQQQPATGMLPLMMKMFSH